MSNRFTFHRSPLDILVENLTPEERTQILHDGDAYEQTGQTGDTLLRLKGMEFAKVCGVRESFTAVWLKEVLGSCQKISAVRQIEAEMRLDPEHSATAEAPDLRQRAIAVIDRLSGLPELPVRRLSAAIHELSDEVGALSSAIPRATITMEEGYADILAEGWNTARTAYERVITALPSKLSETVEMVIPSLAIVRAELVDLGTRAETDSVPGF